MAFIVIDDISTAQGTQSVAFTADQEAQLQYYIDFVCDYIESVTGTSYSVHTDVTIRYKSDSYGNIELAQNPVTTVTSIKDKDGNDQTPISELFDGVDTIYFLCPLMAHDVKLTYGYSSAPKDIQGVAVEAVKRAFTQGKSGSALSEKQVGDVRQVYANPLDAALAFTKTDREILGLEGDWSLATLELPHRFEHRKHFRSDRGWDSW